MTICMNRYKLRLFSQVTFLTAPSLCRRSDSVSLFEEKVNIKTIRYLKFLLNISLKIKLLFSVLHYSIINFKPSSKNFMVSLSPSVVGLLVPINPIRDVIMVHCWVSTKTRTSWRFCWTLRLTKCLWQIKVFQIFYFVHDPKLYIWRQKPYSSNQFITSY